MRYNDFEGGGGSLFFPYYDLRGEGGQGNENMLLDALIIPVFYFISKKMLIKN